MTDEEFISKSDHEGGFYETFQWGLKPEDIEDPQLRELWSEFCVRARQLHDVEDRIWKLMSDRGISW